MRYPRGVESSDRGWRPAVRFRGAALLNERWSPGDPSLQPCPVCDGEITVADHAVHSGGEIFHPGCLLYRGSGE